MAPAIGRVHRALLPQPTPEPGLEYADQKDQFATTNSTLWRQQRYAPRDNHYLWDACAGIGTVGDVCPQVLPCATPRLPMPKTFGAALSLPSRDQAADRERCGENCPIHFRNA